MITRLSIDSRFADQQFAGTSDFQIRLPSTIKNIMRVSLVSVELDVVGAAPYYLLQLLAPDPLETVQHPLGGGTWIGAFAKIVIRGGLYVLDSCVRPQEYTFPSPANIATLRIRLLDPFGTVVNLHGVDWSLTLDC